MAIKGITAKYRNRKPIAFIDKIFIYGFDVDSNRDLNVIISYDNNFRANRVFQDKRGPYFTHHDKKYYMDDVRDIK